MEGWVLPSAEEAREMRAAERIVEAARAADEAERRREHRVAYQARVSVSSETNFFASLSENLSEGGVFISTYSPPATGTRIWMQVGVDGVEEIMVEGVVRWHRTDEAGLITGCGVQFADLDERAKTAIGSMLRACQRQPLLADL